MDASLNKCLLKFGGLSNAKAFKSCRSRLKISYASLISKIVFDTADNEMSKVCWYPPTPKVINTTLITTSVRGQRSFTARSAGHQVSGHVATRAWSTSPTMTFQWSRVQDFSEARFQLIWRQFCDKTRCFSSLFFVELYILTLISFQKCAWF